MESEQKPKEIKIEFTCEVKEKTRRSYIEDALTDTTLQTPNTPSFNLKVDDEE